MCDTFAATPQVTEGGVMILAKNSDREPNEAQNVTFVPAMSHGKSDKVQCTYLKIPQAEKTYAAILSRPFWMYGAEMGMNEKGVAIGNEAVFTKEKYRTEGLTGMDMVRLALERSASAKEALEIIVSLLDKYGQGGKCGYKDNLSYHNSFFITDPEEAYILETADMVWVAKKIDAIASISNCLTIGDDYDLSSPGIEDYALKKGYLKKGKNLDFARDFSDTIYTHFAKGRVRRQCSYEKLSEKNGSLAIRDMMAILRDHNMDEPYRPGTSPMERICLHAGGLISTQSTGSMVAVLKKGQLPRAYITGTSAPCLSLFKPHVLSKGQRAMAHNRYSENCEDGFADLYGTARGSYDSGTLWWTGEDIHRRALMNYGTLTPAWQEERDLLEKKMIADVEKAAAGNDSKKISTICSGYQNSFTEKTAEMADEFIRGYKEAGDDVSWFFKRYWKKMNRRSQFLFER